MPTQNVVLSVFHLRHQRLYERVGTNSSFKPYVVIPAYTQDAKLREQKQAPVRHFAFNNQTSTTSGPDTSRQVHQLPGQPTSSRITSGPGIPYGRSSIHFIADLTPNSSPLCDHSSCSSDTTAAPNPDRQEQPSTSSTSANRGTVLIERDSYSIDRFRSDEVNSHPEYKYSTSTESMPVHKRAIESNIEAFNAVFNKGNQG